MSELQAESQATMEPREHRDATASLLDAAENAAGTLEGVRKLLGHLTDRASGTTMPVEALEPIISVMHEIQESLDAAVGGYFAAHHKPSADAQLIALCERYALLAHQIHQTYDEPGNADEAEEARDARRAPLWAEQEMILEKIDDKQAKTIKGAQARFRAIWAHEPQCLTPQLQHGTDDAMLASLLRDLSSVPGWIGASRD